MFLDVGIGGETNIAGHDASLLAPRRGVGLFGVAGTGLHGLGFWF